MLYTFFFGFQKSQRSSGVQLFPGFRTRSSCVVLHAEGLKSHGDMGLRTIGLQQFLKSEGCLNLNPTQVGLFWMLIRSQISWEIDILCDLLRFYTYLQIFTRIFRLHLYVSFIYTSICDQDGMWWKGNQMGAWRPPTGLVSDCWATVWELLVAGLWCFILQGHNDDNGKGFMNWKAYSWTSANFTCFWKVLVTKLDCQRSSIIHFTTIGPHCKVLRQLVMFVEKLLICDLYNLTSYPNGHL